MCLGIIGRVISKDEKEKIAKVDIGGGAIVQADASFEDVEVGDYVVVHAGVIISKASEEDYKLREEIFRSLSS
ncbi:MAG: HypC/HybG/HupF family hydrogenase formation chaperone [Fervidicoccaceae archaeon]